MKNLKAHEIRKMWLDFFKSKGHEVTPSASLLPQDDPTLLWINAGVAPLKKYFDGREKPNNPRLCNAQKSIRTNKFCKFAVYKVNMPKPTVLLYNIHK